MDSAIGLSDTSTVLPSDSASQAPTSNTRTAPGKTRGGRKPHTNSPLSNDKPPGAVKVPKGGQSNTGKASPVTSTTIPLSGWGEIDLVSFRKDIEPTFTIDARPYADLVDTVYQSMQSRYSSGGKHIPRALFRYYCFQFWWFRFIWLHKANGNVVSSEQKNFLNIMTAGEEFQLPSPIAQYLGNAGNFLQGGEQFYFRLMEHNLVSIGNGSVQKGWFETDSATNNVTDDTFWIYAQLPSPGVFTSTVCNEADATLPTPGQPLSLGHIAPTHRNDVVPTENIIGWSNSAYSNHHSSWRSTFASLGWSRTNIPSDAQTQFNLSTSTMKWMSDRLATMKDFKLHPSKQVSLSVNGSPMQAYWLGTEVPQSQVSQLKPGVPLALNQLCASRHSDLAVLSRYNIDSKILAPAFSFGYRIERSNIFKNFDANTQPVYYSRNNFTPWLLLNAAGDAPIDLTRGQLANKDAPLRFGSQRFINVRRFATHELNRSVGLDAALVLSDTK